MKKQRIGVYSQQDLVDANASKEGMKVIFGLIGFVLFLLASILIIVGIISLEDTLAGWIAIGLGCLGLSVPAMSIYYCITASHIEYYIKK